ncbi:MAG TPA: PP2C family protein-serine/threonine phosphatase, partial [Leptospiraceae bacterium]|nr:PP2C family protein-serine/threonine phosphatase [Leptospiraceae bacterium]
TFMALEFFESGKVLYSGAHQDVLVVRSETGKVEKQESRGFWLGLEEDISPFLTDSEFHLKDNDFIFLYTDGVTEAEKNGQLFGVENLCSVLENSSDRKPEEIRDSVLSALQTYRQSDDVSFVIIKKNRR